MNGSAFDEGTAVADGLMAGIWISVNGVLALGAYRIAGLLFRNSPPSVRWLAAVLIFISTIAVAAFSLGTLGVLDRWPLLGLVDAVGLAMACV